VTQLAEGHLCGLREEVPGVLACLIASSDGLLVAEQTQDLEPTRIAALTSTLAALASQAVQATRSGDLLDGVIRGSQGTLAVYALGETAVLAVIADRDVSVAWLHVKTRPVISRLLELSDRFDRFETFLPR
jgi:predicted regulator of Ras-like GTPase activity (Roadblock/LC7/MglB family)